MYCQNCGSYYAPGASKCSACGAWLINTDSLVKDNLYNPDNAYIHNNIQDSYQNTNNNLVKTDSGKGMGIASMVLGIVSIVLFWGPFFGLPCGIVGMVLACVAKSKGYEEGMQRAGYVTSFIGIALCAVYFVIWIIYILNHL